MHSTPPPIILYAALEIHHTAHKNGRVGGRAQLGQYYKWDPGA